MSQSAVTVTAENPTPPTNLIFVGSTPPLDIAQAAVDDGIPAYTATLATENENATGAGGPTKTVFNTNTAAAGSGSSVAHEGRGAETSFTQSYSASIYAPVPLVTVGCGPAYSVNPNQNHASTLSPASNPTLTSLGTTTSVSGATGTYSQTVTGVGFTRQSVIYVNGVAQATTFNSSTSLTAAAVAKKTSAGTWPVTVVTGGVVTTAAQTWTFT